MFIYCCIPPLSSVCYLNKNNKDTCSTCLYSGTVVEFGNNATQTYHLTEWFLWILSAITPPPPPLPFRTYQRIASPSKQYSMLYYIIPETPYKPTVLISSDWSINCSFKLYSKIAPPPPAKGYTIVEKSSLFLVLWC